MAEKCISCGRSVQVYHYCDEVVVGPWCSSCFDKTDCGKGMHGEGCATDVFDDKVEVASP